MLRKAPRRSADIATKADPLSPECWVSNSARQGTARRRREDIEIAMEERHDERSFPSWKSARPMWRCFRIRKLLLGLLGTVVGLIQAFTAVANANPARRPICCPPDISVAMNTTAFGLMSAIPLFTSACQATTSTTGRIVDSLEMASVKALNSISNFNRRHLDENEGRGGRPARFKPEPHGQCFFRRAGTRPRDYFDFKFSTWNHFRRFDFHFFWFQRRQRGDFCFPFAASIDRSLLLLTLSCISSTSNRKGSKRISRNGGKKEDLSTFFLNAVACVARQGRSETSLQNHNDY